MDPTRPAAMGLGVTSRTGRVSLPIRRLQVRVLPGAPKPQVMGMVCRSSDDCRGGLVIPSVLHGAMIAPLERAVTESRSPSAEEAVSRRPVGCVGRSLRSQPERRPGWLHGLVDHGQQLAGQGGQVELVAETGREPLHGAGGVVAAAVEVPVDQRLNPPRAGWKSATTARVAAATTRLDSRPRSRPSPRTMPA
jgi:hypothetical protein